MLVFSTRGAHQPAAKHALTSCCPAVTVPPFSIHILYSSSHPLPKRIGQSSRRFYMKSLSQTLAKIRPMAKIARAVTRLFGVVFIASTAFATAALAQPAEGGGHRGPPPEALAACKSLAAGAECGFTGERGSMKGSCWAPEGKPLACKPKDAPGAERPSAPKPKS